MSVCEKLNDLNDHWVDKYIQKSKKKLLSSVILILTVDSSKYLKTISSETALKTFYLMGIAKRFFNKT